jgi:CrcB protein
VRTPTVKESLVYRLVRTPTVKKKGIHCFCLHNIYYKLIRRAKKIISLHLLKQQMSKAWILVGIGGLLGSISRYAMASFITNTFPYSFPIGTFIVNIIGCLLIGVFYGLADQFGWLSPEWRIFLTTGFCGGFTTFSSFAYENILLLQRAEFASFAWYSIGSFTVGLLAVFSGLLITKFFIS